MDKLVIEKGFFRIICRKDEIERIFNVENASDYLLKLRAETIVDHMRLLRVYRNKALAKGDDWSLEQSFDATHFRTYLDQVTDPIKQKCGQVVFGNMFSNDPNGTILASDHGPVITISESLLFFLKFAHLALLHFKSNVPFHVRMNALRIAVRVMLQTEAMDFYMDPRGIIPKDVAEAIHAPIPRQLEFIAGHEFAHYVLDHITPNTILDKPIFHAISTRGGDYRLVPTYSKSQQQELDADTRAILLAEKNPHYKIELLDAAVLWFGCLELYETIADVMYPSNPWKPSSHPSARERIDNLLTKIRRPTGYRKHRWKPLLKSIDTLKPILIADVSTNIEAYETYGSLYLDEPNSEWRGRELVDREDYY